MKDFIVNTTASFASNDVDDAKILAVTAAGTEKFVPGSVLKDRAVMAAVAAIPQADWQDNIDAAVAALRAELIALIPATTGLPNGDYLMRAGTLSDQWVAYVPPTGGAVPAAPVIDIVATNDSVSTAEAAAGVTITGTAQIASVVSVSWGGVGKTNTANGAGVWTVSYTSGEIPAAGATTVSAYATDADGPSTTTTRAVTVEAPASSSLVAFGDHLITSTSWARLKGGGKILFDSLMNNAVGAGNNMVAHRFRCTTSGAAAEHKGYWIAQANTNTYSGGTGGVIRIRIYPVNGSNQPNLAAAHLAEGSFTPALVNGGYPATFKHYTACALTSITPLVAGTIYCLVYENTSASRSTNFLSADDTVCVSNNEPINPWLADTELAVLRGVGTAASATWTDETNPATETTGYTQIPNFQLKLADGTAMGQMRAEGSNTNFADNGSGETRSAHASSTYPVRTRIVAPRDWTVIGFGCSVSFSVGGTMLVEMKNSAGTVLQSKTITQATNHSTQNIMPGETAAVTTWHNMLFDAPISLLSGQTYYLQYTPQGSTRVWFSDVRDFREGTFGFASLDDLHSFSAQHFKSGAWIGFYQWAHTVSINGGPWRDVIHLA